MLRRVSLISIIITFLAPLIFANCAIKQPIGPAPIIANVSLYPTPIFSSHAYTEVRGSPRLAASKLTSSGIS
ncbi:hypothetical protein D3C73_1594000 [compost metagenome]